MRKLGIVILCLILGFACKSRKSTEISKPETKPEIVEVAKPTIPQDSLVRTRPTEITISTNNKILSFIKGSDVQIPEGEFICNPFDRNIIRVSKQGLKIEGRLGNKTIIKRPDNAIIRNGKTKDFSHGLYFLPDNVNESDLENAIWKKYINGKGETIEFTVIVSGDLIIKNVVFDCNMGNQQIENQPKNDAEHCGMLVVSGSTYLIKEGKYKGKTVYVSFKNIEVDNLLFVNGGYSDDFWITRSYFYPGVQSIKITNIKSSNRVNPKRSTITFSSPAVNVEMSNCDIYRLELEESNAKSFIEAPSLFQKNDQCIWNIKNVNMEILDLASKGHSVTVNFDKINVTKNTLLYQIDGVIKNSTLTKMGDPRLHRLNMVFENINWHLLPDENNQLRGIKANTQYGESCKIKFINNKFLVIGNVKEGNIFTSERSQDANQKIDIEFINCYFDEKIKNETSIRLINSNENGRIFISGGNYNTFNSKHKALIHTNSTLIDFSR